MTIKGVFHEVLDNLKPQHLLIGLIVTFVMLWMLSRLFPGAAARAGMIPRPLFPGYQNIWPEPIGLMPLNAYWGSSATSTAASQPASTPNFSLASVTGGSGVAG